MLRLIEPREGGLENGYDDRWSKGLDLRGRIGWSQ